MLAAQNTDIKTQGPDGVKAVQLLRKSLVEAFMSMINGIKSPGDENLNNNNVQAPFDDGLFEHIRTMFFYLERLVGLPDLELDLDLARQILDLYCDIVML